MSCEMDDFISRLRYFSMSTMTQRHFTDVSYEVPGTKSTGWGAIRRAIVKEYTVMGLPTHDGSGKYAITSYENFIHATETFPTNKCLGFRPINPDGSARAYEWFTYEQVRGMVENFSAGLHHHAMCPRSVGDTELREQGVLGIMMRNRPEWVIAEQACFLHSIVPVPFYDTAKSDTLSAIVGKLSSLKTIVCSNLTIAELIKTKREHPSLSLTTLVCVDEVTDAITSAARSVGLTVTTFKAVMDSGARLGSSKPRHSPPSPDDVYTFCFTSGTTGEPKGALITHRNMVANSSALSERLVRFTVGNEVCLSFLPLPHMFERVSQLLTICAGGSIGFFQGDALKLVDDLQALRPTRFVAVPRVLTRIQERVMSQVNEAGGLKQKIFNAALHRKMTIGNDPVSMVTDRVMFRKIGAKLGLDRVKQILTGSAPIAPSTLSWFRAVFPGVPVNEGYGQTECTLVCSLQNPLELSAGDCGAPLLGCDVRLQDVPEMGYRSTDTQHGTDQQTIPCLGRGEICIRGDHVFKGYYKQPDKTREAIDEHGWLHTGDIGMWAVRGQLKIIDRKKNIFKLSQGEYVAPEKIESLFATSKFVLQSLVYGDSFRNHLVAVIVPNPDFVKEWATKQGMKMDLAALCAKPELKRAILAELQARSKHAKLNGFEVVKNIHLEPEAWTGDNLLTPTFKLKRKDAEIKYKAEIDRMYQEDSENSKL